MDRYIIHFIILDNGDVYERRTRDSDESFIEDTRYLGNFWEGVQVPSWQVEGYRVAGGSGTSRIIHSVILENGDVYIRKSMRDEIEFYTPCLYIGNILEGAISTDQSTWGSIKDQFK